MKQGWVRVLLWLVVLATAVMIFCFSDQDGVTSGETSGWLVERVIRVVEPDYGTLPEAEQLRVFDAWQLVIRKGAHFSEYALLGCLLRLLCACYPLRRRGVTAWLSSAAYAVTDECHQLLSTGRSPMALDVLIDSAGALVGVLAAWALLRWRSAKHRAGKTA